MKPKTLHFEYPWNGHIYSVDIEPGTLPEVTKVKLPDGEIIGVRALPGFFPTVVELESPSSGTQLNAKVVIEQGDFKRKFEGDWGPLTKFIEICSSVNTLCSIDLTEEEFNRLEDGGLQELKESLSDRASSLLYLYEEYPLNSEGPSLQLFRTGGCP